MARKSPGEAIYLAKLRSVQRRSARLGYLNSPKKRLRPNEARKLRWFVREVNTRWWKHVLVLLHMANGGAQFNLTVYCAAMCLAAAVFQMHYFVYRFFTADRRYQFQIPLKTFQTQRAAFFQMFQEFNFIVDAYGERRHMQHIVHNTSAVLQASYDVITHRLHDRC